MPLPQQKATLVSEFRSANMYLATHIFADSVQEAVSDPDNAITWIIFVLGDWA